MRLQYVIPEANIDQLEKMVYKANKQCVKLGLSPVVLTNNGLDHVEVEAQRKNKSQERCWYTEGNIPDQFEPTGRARNYFNFTIQGDQPKFEGWTFVATLLPVPTDDGLENQIRKVPSYEGNLPKEYRDKVGTCDHCGYIRNRKETYVVEHENGDIKAVGSGCIKDFLGGVNVHAIAEYLQLLNDFSNTEVCDDTNWGVGGRETPIYMSSQVLTYTSAVIRAYGWLSKSKAYENGGKPTAEIVQLMMTPYFRLSPYEKRIVREVNVENEDKELAEKVLEYIRGLNRESENDYIYNLSLLSRSEYITHKSLGLLCSAVIAFKRHIDSQEKVKTFENSQHLGEIKERLELDIEVLKVYERSSSFGLTRIHKMVTPYGDVITWFASNGGGFEEGYKGRVKMTVKKHDEFRGIKQTVVNRVTEVK